MPERTKSGLNLESAIEYVDQVMLNDYDVPDDKKDEVKTKLARLLLHVATYLKTYGLFDATGLLVQTKAPIQSGDNSGTLIGAIYDSKKALSNLLT